MQINFLKKVVENSAGEAAVKIVDLLYGKKDVNEFNISKKLSMTINQTRNLLYRLSHLGIISSIRKKDKRKGWYIYFWTFNVLKSLEVLDNSVSQEVNELKTQLQSKKQKRFYKCKICGREINEESALLTNFVCAECGEVYELMDNAPIINEISKKIEKLNKEQESIKKEIREEKDKIEKKLAKTIKKEKNLKAKNRAKLKLKNKRLLMKAKKSPSKKSKKKRKKL